MKIKEIKDNNTNFENVVLLKSKNTLRETPHCKIHGAMNKVSLYESGGYWRCLFKNCRTGCEETK